MIPFITRTSQLPSNKVWYKFANKQSAVEPNRARLSHLTSVAQATYSEVIDYFEVKFLLSDEWINAPSHVICLL